MELAMWHAMNLQLIVFPVDQQVGRNANWWQEVTGSDEFERTQKKHEQTDDGPYGNYGLMLNINPIKTTWTLGIRLNPEVALDALAGGFPTLGEFNAVGDTFRDLMNRWLNGDCPAIRRLAFAADLIVKHTTLQAAHNAVSEFLPMAVDPEASDFQYRINRKQLSSVIEGVTLNKLRTWSAAKLEIIGEVGVGGPNIGNVEFASRLQLDINTDHSRQDILPQHLLNRQFVELVAVGENIAANGDRG